MENALRLRWARGSLIIVAAASLMLAAPVIAAQASSQAQSFAGALPDAPSALLFSANGPANAGALTDGEDQNASQDTSQSPSQNSSQSTPSIPPAIAAPNTQVIPPTPPTLGKPAQPTISLLPPCPKHAPKQSASSVVLPTNQPPCEKEDQIQLIVDTGHVIPLTSEQKGILAFRAVTNPFNLLTIAVFSGVSVAADAHSVYGPGFAGWGRLSGYSLAEDIQSETTGVYLLPSLFHEDPRYHRMPGSPVRRRIEHALIHPFVSQHDDGSLIPNYATLINYPLSAEISNLYVPGIATNAPSTAKRVLVGYATDPVGPLIAEFLPDFAKRVHIHIILAQQILNRIALGSGAQSSSF